ncbi:transcription termination factor Rho [Streptomyces sp. NPDC004365]|uniref:transcription termination factor Rho n=1 Tax=Streptomyces sp. NPDC093676 TaxID=3366050 RepID=UPI00382A907F
MSGTELIGRGFRVLAEGLGPFVDEQMRAAQVDGGDWVAALEAKDRSRFGHARSLSVSDPALLLRVLWAQWHVFDGVLPVVARSYAGELRDVRNRWAHNDAFADSEVRRALETMELLLRRVGAHASADAVLGLYAPGSGQPAAQDVGLNAPRLAAEAQREPVDVPGEASSPTVSPAAQPPAAPGNESEGAAAEQYHRQGQWATATRVAGGKGTQFPLHGMVLRELQQLAASLGVSETARMRKGELIAAITERSEHGPRQGAGTATDAGSVGEAASPASPTVTDDSAATSVQEEAGTQPSEEAAADTGDGGQEQAQGEARGEGEAGRRGRRGRYRNRRERPAAQEGEADWWSLRDDDVLIPIAGILDILDNYAFVRTTGYLPGPHDVYVSLAQVRKYRLRKGDHVTGVVRQTREGEREEKFKPLVRADSVNGAEPGVDRPKFGRLTPLIPQERLRLETDPRILAPRIIDLFAPIGKGQRGLILAPPKAGRTTVLQDIARALTHNNPECHLMIVLVDERPEAVTDMQRSVKGEVISSTADRLAEDHIMITELAFERAKRLVELGHDVVILLDSISRLASAYNLTAPASGRLLPGGLDPVALHPVTSLFTAARTIEDGGSLTVLATASVGTGSRLEETVAAELGRLATMRLRLDRTLAAERIFPAFDLRDSGTQNEELLLGAEELAIVSTVQRVVRSLDAEQAIRMMVDKLGQTKSNIEFLMEVRKSS